MSDWKNRIVGEGTEAPDQLLANPMNWRIHPKAQQDALTAALDDVGWVRPVLVNKVTGHVVDGHLRVGLALSKGEQSVPVSYVELTEAEEAAVLASLDPLVAMAVTDKGQLAELMKEISVSSEELAEQLTSMSASKPEGDALSSFREISPESLDTEYRCPKCSYEWSGKARGG